METNLKKALDDINALRNLIEGSQGENSQSGLLGFVPNMFIHGLLLLFSLTGIYYELMNDYQVSGLIVLTANSRESQIIGLSAMMTVFMLGVLILYFVIWLAAINSKMNFNAYIMRNFKYLRGISFLSDLAVKALFLSLLILSKHPQWISPLLFVFLSDYLIQKRLFIIPPRLSILIAGFGFVAAYFQFSSGYSQVIWPLCMSIFITLLSMMIQIVRRKNLLKKIFNDS